MAWNPAPEIAVARDAARKLGDADQIIIITLNHAKEQMGLFTYGKTKALCDDAYQLGKVAYEAAREEYAETH